MSRRFYYVLAMTTGLTGVIILLNAAHTADGPRILLGAIGLILAAIALMVGEHHDNKRRRH